MSREILEAMHALAREKGIEPEKLMIALEDALLSAYKKQPGSAKYARVEMDRETADFRVIELIIPERLEAHLIVETIDEETTIDPETGEMREPEEPEIDPAKFAEYRDQIEERDVTPDDFGRIAAQTAKQVILQRIREAERDMMYEEYRDRVGELITGIVQQSDSRYTLVSCASASRRCCRSPSRSRASATTTRSASRPSSRRSRPRPRGPRSSSRAATPS
jgi:N utilization substance protein A